MNSLELAAIDWLGRGWLLMLAFTATVLLVAALRRPCRRLFGTERAFQLWLLPPLAMLASQLPHAPGASGTAFSSMVYMITSATEGLPTHAASALAADWRNGVMVIWSAGVVAFLLLKTWAQWRYRRRLMGAMVVRDVPSRWPVWRAAGSDVGPALVGAWRVRIVLPADFDLRYDDTERALILAHETAHAQRRDGCWCLLAQIVVALFWFHPLAWWALGALRHDQELACDAAVLREHGAHRRCYANAMLKTQAAAFALPVGCTWSPRHPLTERIAMLKLSLPSRLRRHAGRLAGLVLASIVGGSVYAASAPPEQHAAASINEYQLEMKLELTTDAAHASHAERMTVALCMAPGKSGTVTTHGWKLDATPTPEGDNRLRIDLAVAAADGKAVVRTRLHGVPGESVHAEGKGMDGQHWYAIDMTALAGCSARTAMADTGARLLLVSESVQNASARAVAVSVAAKAGLTLLNPELLDERLISLNFDQVPAERAVQLVADIDGKKAVFEGRRVHFELK